MLTNPAITGGINSLTPQQFFQGIVRVGITALFVLAVLFFFFKLVLGGLAWINSSGEKQKLEQARGQIMNSIVGLFVVFLSLMAVKLIETIFSISVTSFAWSSIQL